MKPVRQTALEPGSMDSVQLTSGFWGNLQEKNASVTLPHEIKWLEKSGALANFDRICDDPDLKGHVGMQFIDSDVYKVLEALAWEFGRTKAPWIQESIDTILDRILPVEADDGYLNTAFGHMGRPERYSDMEWGHELYCAGHLIQAGVARLRTGFDSQDPLVALSLRVADHVCVAFAEGNGIDGHPEIEVALVELYRATGSTKYLDQAKAFVDRRGYGALADIEFGRSYFQDDIPVREADVLRGHAVRALYLAAGALDVAVEESDSGLFSAIERQYRRTLERRTYITGGMGAHHQDEAFGEDFELPPDRAYCETCAGIASVMVAWRLLLATGDLAYGDVIERTLYNIVATSVSQEGDQFFYANPLQQRVLNRSMPPDVSSPRASSELRASWFYVPCCPPNYSRTVAQLASYVTSHTADSVQLIQYMAGTIEEELSAAGNVKLRVETDYPHDSIVTIFVEQAPTDKPWKLDLRVPRWCKGATFSIDGKVESATNSVVSIHDPRPGQRVVLDLPVEPRFVYPDPRIDAIRGCVAVEKGPLVMCAESVDQPEGTDVGLIEIDASRGLESGEKTVRAHGRKLHMEGSPDKWAYSENPPNPATNKVKIKLSPYWNWGNRGPVTMRIWIPTAVV